MLNFQLSINYATVWFH